MTLENARQKSADPGRPDDAPIVTTTVNHAVRTTTNAHAQNDPSAMSGAGCATSKADSSLRLCSSWDLSSEGACYGLS